MQDVEGETYLGIQRLRFYFRCANCAAEFILKTDPANTDYTMEKGATRNYEPWREKERDVAVAVAEREEEERGNAMKVLDLFWQRQEACWAAPLWETGVCNLQALENRTLESKREMDIMTALDELRSIKSRHERVDADAALAALRQSVAKNVSPEDSGLAAEDEVAIKQMLQQQRSRAVQRLGT